MYGQVPFQAVSTIFAASFNAKEDFCVPKIFFGVAWEFFFGFFNGGSSPDFVGVFSDSRLAT